MHLILVGPGRAGMALSLRLRDGGHTFAGVLARDGARAEAAARTLETTVLAWDSALPVADLALIAVRDDAIAAVADRLGPHATGVDCAVHLSGFSGIDALAGMDTQMRGSFHPLQTLPDAEVGASRLDGAWVAVTASDDYLADRLFGLARSAGMHAFEIEDDAKPLYHAAAAAAANFTLTALAIAEQLFDTAGVPSEAVAPLVEAVVANAAELGPVAALTGPVARADLGTVRGQLEAVAAGAPGLLEDFKALVLATARIAGTESEIAEVLE